MPSSRSPVAARVLPWLLSWTALAVAPASAQAQLAQASGTASSPLVRVSVLPPANAAGWHNTPVRLVYTCADGAAGVTRCPAEATVDTEGPRQTVSAAARDQEGREVTAAVTLSIDTTPPIVHMTSPTHGQVVTGTTVTVAGTVTDALSGVAGARCNGVPATVTRGTISCTVPVRPGFNVVVLQASDVAGNTAIEGVRVTAVAPTTAVAVVPQVATLLPLATREFRLQDQAGMPVLGATWTTDETGVLSATQNENGVDIVARSVGTATVRATWHELTAEAVVTVVAPTAEGRLPYGSTHWSLRRLDLAATQKVLVARHVEPDGPSMLVLEAAPTGAVVRGVSQEGIPVSTWVVPAESKVALVDRSDGLLLITGQSRGLLRVPGNQSDRPWWYVPEGARQIECGVQAPDGTVFALETADDGAGTQTLVGLDGRTGALRFRIASLGRQHHRVLNGNGPGSVVDTGVRTSPMHPLIFGYDDAAYLGTFSEHRSIDRSTGLRTERVDAILMRVEPDGSARTTVMDSRDATRPAGVPAMGVTMGPLIPDPRGGSHVEWTIANDGSRAETRHGRGGFGGTPTSVLGPLPFSRVGDELTGYDETGTAYDLETGAVKFTTPPGSVFVSALVGGGVAYRLGAELFQTDATGAVTKTSPMPGMSGTASPVRKPPER